MIKCNLSCGDDPIEQIKECLEIIEEMNKTYKKGEEIFLDLSEIPWIIPCSALLLSSKIRELLNKNIKINYSEPINEKVKKYLRDIGFPLGTKVEGDTFSPIKHFGNEVDIDTEVNNLLENMKNKVPNTFGDSIYYILGELADNISQHSKFSNATIMAQYYPQKGYIDIGVFDNGLTIPKVFEKNNIKFSKDSEAILLALSGTTTKKEDPSRGHGLSSSKELVQKALDGEMHIISRKGCLIISPDSKDISHNFTKNKLLGTLLYIRLKTPRKHLNIIQYL
ncbi:sensor histidine kinase [Candidatus Pacearchaeota archaeon]|nr:sensor histidine kinase [Candidatus Pacearchaeota archaeon]